MPLYMALSESETVKLDLQFQEMDVDNRAPLYQHIVLSGGSTMFPGLQTRLEKELKALYLQHVLKVSETACPPASFFVRNHAIF